MVGPFAIKLLPGMAQGIAWQSALTAHFIHGALKRMNAPMEPRLGQCGKRMPHRPMVFRQDETFETVRAAEHADRR